jgi:hypothetical protein
MTGPNQSNHIVANSVAEPDSHKQPRHFGGTRGFEGAECTNMTMENICSIIKDPSQGNNSVIHSVAEAES